MISANVASVAGAAIWPSAGLALAALVRFGISTWPGVFIGSLWAQQDETAIRSGMERLAFYLDKVKVVYEEL